MKLVIALCTAATALVAALPAAADAPTVRYLTDDFVDINPCTGTEHDVHVDVTAYTMVPGHTSRATRVITTSSGFVGRGIEVGIFDDGIFIVNDTLVNDETGQRMRAHLILVANPATGELQVFDLALTCIPPGRT